MIIKINVAEFDTYTVKLPHMVYDKLSKAIDNEVLKANINYDPFGLSELNRTYRSNRDSFRDKCFYIVSRMYKNLSFRYRYKKSILCSDYSEHQLSDLLGDCTRNKTKIGWQSIKSFLIDNGIIFIADKLFIHDSYLNKSQSIAYSIVGLEDLRQKPVIKTSKNGHRYSSNRSFMLEDLEMEEYIVTNKSLLKAIAKEKVTIIDTDTVAGHQWELLTKYRANKLDYEFVANVIAGKAGEKYLFHEDKNVEGKRGECSLLKSLSLEQPDYKDFKVRQSPYSSRIFSNLTSTKKYARSFINFNDKDNIFAEFDMKSSQIVLAAFMYHKSVGGNDTLNVLKYIIQHDIYEVLAKKLPKIDPKTKKVIGKYTREEMKKLAFKSIFSQRDYEDNAFSMGLKKLFPDFYRFLSIHKTKSRHSKLAIKLQRIESSIFVGNYGYNYITGEDKAKYDIPQIDHYNKCILGELYRMGIDAFSIHDSILVNVSQAKKFTQNKDIESVWDEVIAPIVIDIFHNKFFTLELDKSLITQWVMMPEDESDIELKEFRKSVGEMKLFTRNDNFNQFTPELFNKISNKHNVRMNFYSYEEYRQFTEKSDFRSNMIDFLSSYEEETYWETHDKNDPKYKEYFDLLNDCPF